MSIELSVIGISEQLIPRQPDSYSENFLTILLIVCLIIYAFINVFFYRRLNQVIKSFISHRFVNQLIRDGELLKENISLLLYAIYFITFSILLYLANKYLIIGYQVSGIGYLQILSIIIFLFILKGGFIRLIGIIFKTRRETKEYLRIQYVFNQATGLFLLPLLIIIIYIKLSLLLKLSFIFLLLILAYRLIRVIIYRISPTNFSVFYLILYLCTIEILPLLIFFKLIYSQLIYNLRF